MDPAAGLQDSIDRAVEMANRSGSGEAYQTVRKTEHYKVGVVVTAKRQGISYSIELLVRMFAPSAPIDALSLGRATEVIAALAGRGYAVSHEDDGWLCCRMVLERDRVVQECQELIAVIEDRYGGMVR